MKKLSLSIVFFCMLVSCTRESDFESSENAAVSNEESILSKRSSNLSSLQGKKYTDAFNSYLQKNEYPDSVEELTDQIQFIWEQFSDFEQLQPITNEYVLLIVNDPVNELTQILEKSSLSTEAKARLSNFIQNLINLEDYEYEEIHNYIISFEGKVSNDAILTDQEKESILTVSSISTYSIETASERKDKDWEKSVGNKKVQPPFGYNEASIISVIALLPVII
jgi:hypothetical protein